MSRHDSKAGEETGFERGEKRAESSTGAIATLWLLPILVVVAVLSGAATTFGQSVSADQVNHHHGDTLAITGDGSTPTFTTSTTLSFTIVVSNPAPAGTKAARNVLLTDTLPISGGLAWATATSTAGICVLTQNYLSCELGDIPAGQHVTVVVTSKPLPSAAIQDQRQRPRAVATADGCLSAKDRDSATCTPAQIKVEYETITSVVGHLRNSSR